MARVVEKDLSIGATLEYKLDLMALTHLVTDAESDYLEAGETISTTPGDVTVVSDNAAVTVGIISLTDTNTSITAWLTGVSKKKVKVTFTWITSESRKDSRSIYINCFDRFAEE